MWKGIQIAGVSDLNKDDLHPELVSRLLSGGVDIDRMISFLDNLNSGRFDYAESSDAISIPDISHPSIVDMTRSPSRSMPLAAARARFTELSIPFTPESVGQVVPEGILFDKDALERIGIFLYPKAAYGVLNGGAASSYVDIKKNRSLAGPLFDRYTALFERLSGECRNMPKGITPAYINPDGSSGYSFLLMKLRMLLEHKKRYRELYGSLPELILPAFQMTSVHTDAAIATAFKEYVLCDELRGLAHEIGCPSIEIFTESQTMMAAITHSSQGSPRKIFDCAHGQANTPIPLPGGHGQNFSILAPIYRKLRESGVRWVWLGNIDNMGYTVCPVSLAIFALSGSGAAFETSVRTAMDVKGGILVSDAKGRLTCADIGPAISADTVVSLEEAGKTVLFNCGIGLFDLEWLCPRLDEIPYKLPLRVTDQDKDSGLYAQAEQITWEIIGMVENPLFFAVRKDKRFIAAKLLMETIMTSVPPTQESISSEITQVSHLLHDGLLSLLEGEYGLVRQGGRLVPR